MEPKNGYFQLHLQEGKGTCLRVYPPKNGGEQVKVAEIVNYLHRRHYNNVDQVKISKALKHMPDGAFQLKLSDEIKYHEDETLVLNMSPDKMKVYGRFYPPSNEGKNLDASGIIEELASNKVKVGINQEEIERFLKERQYCKDYLLAQGQEVIQGSDAKIEYFFETNTNARPKQHEDGSVDYHSLDMINHVKQGDELARLTKEIQGTSGYDVLGNEVKPKDVKKLQFSYGNNISLSEDETELIAEVTGHVSLIGGKVFVSNIYEVPADVDASTGDIRYNGNVLIKGNVISGYKVESDGDIIVNGIVEGAVLIAGGQIVLKRGMNGMGRGVLHSGSNIISKFLENCTVHAGGYVETECILHSHVTAGSDINVNGKKGFVTGGGVKAGHLISAKIIGSDMGAETVVEVGIDPEKREQYNGLRENIKQILKEVEKIKPSILDFGKRLRAGEKLPANKMNTMKLLSHKYKELNEKLELEKEQQALLEKELEEKENAAIKVGQAVYPGVKIVIGEEALYVKETMKTCQFVREEGEVKSKPYS